MKEKLWASETEDLEWEEERMRKAYNNKIKQIE
jgi:hypothetical protein